MNRYFRFLMKSALILIASHLLGMTVEAVEQNRKLLNPSQIIGESATFENISTKATEPFDYTLLDELGDRDGFTSESINTPVYLYSDEFRDYYGFMGGVKEGDTGRDFKERNTTIGTSSIGIPLSHRSMGILNPNIIGLDKYDDNQQAISYSYDRDKETTSAGGSTGFDFGLLDSSNKLIRAAMYQSGISSDFTNTKATVEHLFVSNEKNEMLVYGKQALTTNSSGPSDPFFYIRIRISKVKEDRARFTFRIYNQTDQVEKVATAYGNHLDIDGQHFDSKIFTLGNNEGLYIDTDQVSDNNPYSLKFHTAGYQESGTSLQVPMGYLGNDSAYYSVRHGLGYTATGSHNATYPVEMHTDLAPFTMLPFERHPGFTFQYPLLNIEPKTYQDYAADISVSSTLVDQGNITVSYVDEAGGNIADQKKYALDVGEKYNEAPIKIAGYRYVKTEGVASGTIISEAPINIKFIYEKDETPVTVSYVDESGKIIAPAKQFTLKNGETYDEKAIGIADYTYLKTEGTASGTVTSTNPIKITFVYTKNATLITVSYVNESGKDIAPKKEYTLKDGAKYDEKHITIANYTYLRTEGKASGTISSTEPIKITFVYTKETAGITVSYVDEFGKDIADKKRYTLAHGETYSEEANEILNYTYLKTEGSATGTVNSTTPIQITFVYSKDKALIAVSYVDEAGNEIGKDKEYKLEIDETYDEKPLTVRGYTLVKTDGAASGTVTSTRPIQITFVYRKEAQFGIKQFVTKLDGKSADEVSLGDVLRYELVVTPDPEMLHENEFYKTFLIEEEIDLSLETIENITLKAAQATVGTVNYNATTRKITGIISASEKLSNNTKLHLVYEATVRKDIKLGTVIKEKGKASGVFTGIPEQIADELISNEVTSIASTGDLLFESAPSSMDFGKLTPATQNDNLQVANLDGDLTVKDLRGTGKKWSMSAKLTELLSNGDSQMPDAFYYKKDGVEQNMNLTTSAKVIEKTTNTQELVNISQNWSGNQDYPFLKIKAGEARRGTYKGIVQWTLQDVPGN